MVRNINGIVIVLALCVHLYCIGPMMFLKSQMRAGVKPEVILQSLLGPSVQIVSKLGL